MTREEAKEMLPIVKAYAEGKKIQVKCKTSSDAITEHWVDVTNPDLDNPNNYRIKPEPTYRPFKDAEECWQEMQKHQPFGWVTLRGNKEYIVRVIEAVIKINDTLYDFAEAKSKFHFADGEPFGVKEDAQ